MQQTFTTDDAGTAPDGWMSVEELAEERWERTPARHLPPPTSDGITEDDLPF